MEPRNSSYIRLVGNFNGEEDLVLATRHKMKREKIAPFVIDKIEKSELNSFNEKCK